VPRESWNWDLACRKPEVVLQAVKGDRPAAGGRLVAQQQHLALEDEAGDVGIVEEVLFLERAALDPHVARVHQDLEVLAHRGIGFGRERGREVGADRGQLRAFAGVDPHGEVGHLPVEVLQAVARGLLRRILADDPQEFQGVDVAVLDPGGACGGERGGGGQEGEASGRQEQAERGQFHGKGWNGPARSRQE